MRTFVVVLLGTLWGLVCPLTPYAQPGSPAKISLTWMSVTNWLFEVGDTRVVTDGYITRIPATAFSGPSFARGVPSTPDVAAIRRLIAALDATKPVNVILTGHSHFDHSFDTAVWAKETGARIIGARSTCLQAVAQGVPPAQCTAVEGGETLSLGSGLSVRVVRWNHSGDIATPAGRLLQAPLELLKSPTLHPGNGGLRPGILQDFPNGGGARAYLFTAELSGGTVSWFYSNTGNAATFQQPVHVDEAFFQQQDLSLDNLTLAPQKTSAHANLQAALTGAELERVDLWIGYSDRPLAERVGAVLKPRAHIPHHWDGLFSPFSQGVPFPFSEVTGAAELTAFLAEQGITFLPPRQYMDKYQLDLTGVTPIPNPAIKEKLGFF